MSSLLEKQSSVRKLTFFCAGTPIGQGSKRLVRGMMIEDAKHLRPWRQAIVADALEAALIHPGGAGRFSAATRIELTFFFRRPALHYGTGRNRDILKPNAPRYKESKPDIDKLTRAVLDALEVAGILADDKLVASVEAIKKYADPDQSEGVHVLVRELL